VAKLAQRLRMAEARPEIHFRPGRPGSEPAPIKDQNCGPGLLRRSLGRAW